MRRSWLSGRRHGWRGRILLAEHGGEWDMLEEFDDIEGVEQEISQQVSRHGTLAAGDGESGIAAYLSIPQPVNTPARKRYLDEVERQHSIAEENRVALNERKRARRDAERLKRWRTGSPAKPKYRRYDGPRTQRQIGKVVVAIQSGLSKAVIRALYQVEEKRLDDEFNALEAKRTEVRPSPMDAILYERWYGAHG